ncbi:hypothetical protein [uncultured Gammaproteobacteria bacterium]|nr:hypothetical protein [uncultured Gammaproteobacteria bacterium]
MNLHQLHERFLYKLVVKTRDLKAIFLLANQLHTKPKLKVKG